MVTDGAAITSVDTVPRGNALDRQHRAGHAEQRVR